jgi:SAM-dependent methyltransferase
MTLTDYDDLLNELDTVERYQDIRINKETVVQGIRECETRYDYIKHAVIDPGRRFTILDIGANFGYYSIRLLEDFPKAFAVLIQPYDEAEVLKKVIELNTDIKDRVIILKTECHKDNIARLSECEHFDLTLCLNILHHFDDPLAIYSSIKQMTRQLIIETPPVNDINACGQQHLAPIFDIVNQECHKKSSKGFQRQTLDSAYSHFYEYRFGTESDVVSEHVHGINLDTFFSLNGIYPSKSAFLERIK